MLVRFSLIVLALPFLACAGIGIAPRVEVEMPPGAAQTLEGYHSWSWLPDPPPRGDVPDARTAALEAAITKQIEDTLHSRGFVRSDARADFHVAYFVSLRRRSQAGGAPGAPRIYSTQNFTPSFVIESSARPVPSHEDIRLTIVASDRDGRLLWRAHSMRRARGPHDGGLETFVEKLLARLPEHDPDGPPAAPGSELEPDTSLALH